MIDRAAILVAAVVGEGSAHDGDVGVHAMNGSAGPAGFIVAKGAAGIYGQASFIDTNACPVHCLVSTEGISAVEHQICVFRIDSRTAGPGEFTVCLLISGEGGVADNR